ncbi:hypothetical protein K445DRAFT_318080 [Daldinia sp. EC12]|nr:hypothetical protein K445DRAFT_318080 [Daldinia sp. EC12]
MDKAKDVLARLYGNDEADHRLDELQASQQEPQQDDPQHGEAEEEIVERVGCLGMLCCGRIHPNMITIMVQLNQAMTGYGAVSVYGSQIFQLLGMLPWISEYATLGNYIFYFITMVFTVNLVDKYGRRRLMLWGSCGLTICFTILAITAMNLLSSDGGFKSTVGTIVLVGLTAIFGASWLTTVWLIPTEIYPDKTRAQGGAISVVVWGIANFFVTMLTPIGFNNWTYWLFVVFACTNLLAGLLIFFFLPETGGRSFQEIQQFFVLAKEKKNYLVHAIDGGRFKRLPS